MTHEPSAEEMASWAELSESWRGQELAADEPLRTEEVARRAARFAGTVRWRNARELAAAAGLVVWGTFDVLRAPGWLDRAPGLAMVAAVSWVVAQLLRFGQNPPPPPPTATTTEVLAHERAQIQRQITLLRGVRRWYLVPLLVPVLVTVGVSVMKVDPRGAGAWTVHPVLILLGVISVIGATFVLVDRLNARAATSLARKLSSLGE